MRTKQYVCINHILIINGPYIVINQLLVLQMRKLLRYTQISVKQQSCFQYNEIFIWFWPFASFAFYYNTIPIVHFQVKFVDQQSPMYVKNKRNCEFWLRGTNRGVLESPQHSLPENTSCLYHLQGVDISVSPSSVPFRPLSPRYPDGFWRPSSLIFPPARYRVWISVVYFHVTPSKSPLKLDQEVCKSYLNVWDGQLWTPTNCNDLYW